MDSENSLYRFCSSVVAFFAAATPLAGFYFGIIAGLQTQWWFGIVLLLGVFVGLSYSRREYSVSRLWDFVWVVWKGLLIVSVAILLIFRVDLANVRGFELVGRLFIGGLAFVIFTIIYGISYQRAYIDSTG